MYKRAIVVFLLSITVGIPSLGVKSTVAALPIEQPNIKIESEKVEEKILNTKKIQVEINSISSYVGNNFIVRNETGLVEEKPDVAFSSHLQEYLAVWYVDRPGNDEIQAQRISKDGSLIGNMIYVSAGPGAERRYPSVIYNSKHQEYLVVWEHYEGANGNSIRGRRVSENGQVLGTADIIIRDPGYNLYTPAKPVVSYAFTSDKYLVVWEEAFHPTVVTSIMGRVISPSGIPEGSEIAISDDPGGDPRRKPDLAYNRKRNEYLVVWQLYENAFGNTSIYARRVTGNGNLLFPTPIEIARANNTFTNPSVAAIPTATNEGQYLVVWELPYGDLHIAGRLVKGDGNPEGQYFYIAWSSEDEVNPVVAGSEDSNRYYVVWSRPTSGQFVYDYISGRGVSTTGALVGEETYVGGFPLADHAAIASGSNGEFNVVFDDQRPPAIDSGIYGQVLGNRIYLPVTITTR